MARLLLAAVISTAVVVARPAASDDTRLPRGDPHADARRVDGASSRPPEAAFRDSVSVTWNRALLDAVRRVRLAPPFTARALAIAHGCMYDAWAAYDGRAVGTVLGGELRRPVEERTPAARDAAVSYAALAALTELFPSERRRFEAVIEALGLDPADASTDITTPAGIGHVACEALLASRRHDGANQLGDVNGGAPSSDYTGYEPLNTADVLVDPNRWQPLATPTGLPQVFVAPFWGRVTPFALARPDQFRPAPPPVYPGPEYLHQAEAVRRLSARLDDRLKVIAEYWADGPGGDTPPGHWCRIAQFVARRDHHDLEADVKMFFTLANALLDASIAVWDCKMAFDYVRPVSAIRFLYDGQLIEAWAGPAQGTRLIPGRRFQSYIPTPPFAEYTSGHSAFSAASATVLRLVTGSAKFGATDVVRAGTSSIEPGVTPAHDMVLSWPTFDRAADEAGSSRQYGGIHFRQSDLQSREMGRAIGWLVWQRAAALFRGDDPPVHR